MAFSISIPPAEFAFLGNPIWFVVSDDVTNHKRFEYKVTILADSEPFEAYRQADNTATVGGLQYILENFFKNSEYPLPDLEAENIFLFGDNGTICKRYSLTVLSVWNTPEETESLFSSNRFAVWGGEKTENYVASTFFDADLVLLTRQPANKTISTTQPEFLYILQTLPTNSGYTLTLEVEITKADATVVTDTIDLPPQTVYNKGKVFAIDVSYAKIVLPITTDLVQSYRVRAVLPTAGDDAYSDWQAYTIDHSTPNQEHFFLFVNGAGGISTLRATGESTETLNTESQIAKRYLRPNHTLQESSSFVASVEGRRTLEFATGYSEDWEIVWQDFLLSRRVYHIKENALHPVRITTNKIVMHNDDLTEMPHAKFMIEYLHPANHV